MPARIPQNPRVSLPTPEPSGRPPSGGIYASAQRSSSEQSGYRYEEASLVVRITDGTLPTAEELSGFEQVVPGAGHKILEEFLATSKTRRSQEWWKVISESIMRFLGLLFAFLLLAGTLGGAIWLADKGHPIVGGTAIVSLLTLYVTIYRYAITKNVNDVASDQQSQLDNSENSSKKD